MDMKKKNRIKELEEMIEVVILSIPREIASQKYYEKALEKASGESARNLFTSFIKEEKRHEANLRKILNDLQNELKLLKKLK
jgi:rubrerythrin